MLNALTANANAKKKNMDIERELALKDLRDAEAEVELQLQRQDEEGTRQAREYAIDCLLVLADLGVRQIRFNRRILFPPPRQVPGWC